jgi:hypothetical protein
LSGGDFAYQKVEKQFFALDLESEARLSARSIRSGKLDQTFRLNGLDARKTLQGRKRSGVNPPIEDT